VKAWGSVAVSEFGFVTTTLAGPAGCAGVVPWRAVELTKATPAARRLPILTVAPATKFVPAIVNGVPPAVGPETGTIVEIVGAVPTVTIEEVLFAMLGSKIDGSPTTPTKFVHEAPLIGLTTMFTVSVVNKLSDEVARLHVTIPQDCEHVPCAAAADTKVTPAGNTSVRVQVERTVPGEAVTVIVYVRLFPETRRLGETA